MLWLGIYTLLAYPEGLPWDQWLIATLMALVGILFLSVEKVKVKWENEAQNQT
jgi:hypothetical protein